VDPATDKKVPDDTAQVLYTPLPPVAVRAALYNEPTAPTLEGQLGDGGKGVHVGVPPGVLQV